MKARIHLFNDVPEETAQQLNAKYPFTQFRRLPTAMISADFADQWSPEHFAWKLWLLSETVSDPGLLGQTVLYMDAGCSLCSWPQAFFAKALASGVAVLEDPRQNNDHWCHQEFRAALGTTAAEMAAQQLWVGAIAFIGGAPLAKQLFAEAWSWGQKRSVIAGPKWSGLAPDGKPFGHRHDQSILSILSGRLGVPRIPLDTVYCDVSVRETMLRGVAIYCHRGHFVTHKSIAPAIDSAWVINLDRRPDRLKRVLAEHPEIADRVSRLAAFDGRALTLTPRIARLFAPHDFAWKKAVMGCALSHLTLWNRLVNESPEVQSYLILEDDARLKPGWLEAWRRASGHLPADWDVVYLGGVLPPNKVGFDACVEKVNDHFGRIKPNQAFGQKEPNRYFHFCAYSYVLSRRGAAKVLAGLTARNGYWTSADHMICNLQDELGIYFLHPLVGGCYQDDDPKYQASAFNDFSRVDGFDSDLWNNTDHFTEAEVASVKGMSVGLDIEGALADAKAPMPMVNDVIGSQTVKSSDVVSTVATVVLPAMSQRRLVAVAGPAVDSSKWYEFSWMKQLLWENAKISLEVERIPTDSAPPTDSPIVLVQRPHIGETLAVLSTWAAAGVKFYVLHLSDEHGTDPIEFYKWPACLGVVRNYVREGLPAKARVIPLGFHWAIPNGDPALHTPRPPFRELVWSFVGTGWAGRREKLAPLAGIPGESKLVFMDEWNSPAMLGREATLAILLNSWCVPCPAGNNPETFRIYEALEAGAVPILVKEGGAASEAFLGWLANQLPLLEATDWKHAANLIYTLKAQPEVYEQYRTRILLAWELMKATAFRAVRDAFQV